MTTALYRRYRPQAFDEVIGQEHVTEPLMQALRSGRVGHAYLFSGPRGCGKTTSARILARCLNCEQGPTPTPCGECESCVALATGGPGSVDVIEIDAASHGGVDDARDLREKAAYGPAQSRYKVYIIDEAHMVTSQGFNALLKIVEEPPEHVKFIFATTEPEKVIGTIRSRTHHYPFRLVPPARLQDYLEELCARENVAVEPGVLSFVVRAGGGSVRDSLSVLDQLIAGSDEAGLTYAGAAALLGFTEGELLDAAVDALAAGDGAGVFRQVDRVIETGQDPRRFVEDLLERFRDLIVLAALSAAGESETADAAVLRGLPQDQITRMRQQAGAFGPGQLSYLADVINAGLTEMTGATSPRLHLELLCARLLLPTGAGDRGYAARLDRLERRLEVGGGMAAPVPQHAQQPGASTGQTPQGDPGIGQGAGPAPGRPSQAPSGWRAEAGIGARGGASPGGAGAPDVRGSDGGRPVEAAPAHERPQAGQTQAGQVQAGRPGADESATSPQPGDGTDRPGAAGVPPQVRTPDGPARGHGADEAQRPFDQRRHSPARAFDDAPRGADHTADQAGHGHDAETVGPAGPPSQSRADAGLSGLEGPMRGGPGAGQSADGRPADSRTGTRAATPPRAAGAPPAGNEYGGGAGESTPQAPPAPPRGGVDTEMIRRSWPDVLQRIYGIRRVTWTFLSEHAQVLDYDGQRLLIGLSTKGLATTFRNGPHGEVVRQALSEALGVDTRVEGIPADDASAPRHGITALPPQAGGRPQTRPSAPSPEPGRSRDSASAPPASEGDASGGWGRDGGSRGVPQHGDPAHGGRGRPRPSSAPMDDERPPLGDDDLPPDEESLPPDPGASGSWRDHGSASPGARGGARPGSDAGAGNSGHGPADTGRPARGRDAAGVNPSAGNGAEGGGTDPATARPDAPTAAGRVAPGAAADDSDEASPSAPVHPGAAQAREAIRAARGRGVGPRGDEAGPAKRENHDDEASVDDEDILDSGAVGQPVIASVLGGVVIREEEG